jgi:hypothetical protein
MRAAFAKREKQEICGQSAQLYLFTLHTILPN